MRSSTNSDLAGTSVWPYFEGVPRQRSTIPLSLWKKPEFLGNQKNSRKSLRARDRARQIRARSRKPIATSLHRYIATSLHRYVQSTDLIEYFNFSILSDIVLKYLQLREHLPPDPQDTSRYLNLRFCDQYFTYLQLVHVRTYTVG